MIDAMKIELLGVTKSFDDAGRKLTVLDEVNATIASGTHCAVIGRSGVGKSTLLHLIGVLDSPNAGELHLGGVDVCTLVGDERSDFRGSNIGFIFQFHHLLHEFSALENVAMPLLINGEPELEAFARAESLLDSVGLAARLDHRPGELSGGEQQRVAIARALVHRPSIVLADEPTGSLDATTGEEIRHLLSTLCKAAGSTLLVVTHNHDLADSLEQVYEMLPGGSLELRKG